MLEVAGGCWLEMVGRDSTRRRVGIDRDMYLSRAMYPGWMVYAPEMYSIAPADPTSVLVHV